MASLHFICATNASSWRRQNASSVDFGNELPQQIVRTRTRTAEEERQVAHSVASKRLAAEDAMTLAMQAAKFGRGYTAEIVKSMPHFLDGIIVKAAVLKRESSHAHLCFSKRARSCIDECQVVPLIRWLKHNNLNAARIGEIVSHAGGDHLETVRPRVEWLKRAKVRGTDLGNVLSKEPTLISAPFEELNYRASILESAGVKREWLGSVISSTPSVLTLPKAELHKRIELFVNLLGIQGSDFGTMVYNLPALLDRHLSSQDVESKVKFLKGLGMEEHCIGRMVTSTPEILTCSLELVWEPVVNSLSGLGVERSGMRRVLALNPAILCLDLHSEVIPKVQFLRDAGVLEQVIPRVLVDFPGILSYSLEQRIVPVVDFLRRRAGVKKHKVGQVIATVPEIIGCSIDNKLEQSVKFYLSLGLRQHQLGDMISAFPLLLKYKPALLLPKFRYLREVMQRPIGELVAFPRFFSYALETRIQPRHKAVAAAGLRPELEQMLACSDQEFEQRLAIKFHI